MSAPIFHGVRRCTDNTNFVKLRSQFSILHEEDIDQCFFFGALLFFLAQVLSALPTPNFCCGHPWHPHDSHAQGRRDCEEP